MLKWTKLCKGEFGALGTDHKKAFTDFYKINLEYWKVSTVLISSQFEQMAKKLGDLGLQKVHFLKILLKCNMQNQNISPFKFSATLVYYLIQNSKKDPKIGDFQVSTWLQNGQVDL